MYEEHTNKLIEGLKTKFLLSNLKRIKDDKSICSLDEYDII